MSAYGRDSHQHCRFAAEGNKFEQHDPRDVAEIERLQQQVCELELNQVNKDDESVTESVVWEEEDTGFHNVFGYPHQRWTPPSDPIRALGIRTNIPDFEGNMQQDVIDWLQTVERTFDLRDVPNNLKALSVEDFITQFERMRMCCGVDEDDEQIIARFLGALRSDISKVLAFVEESLPQHYTKEDDPKPLNILYPDTASNIQASYMFIPKAH
ncbi:hypothetical protein E3N88_07290 [Mikania micrantha]|uniref:Retrotransposon gag domain-containing protein n=1 Tax=Mikania micrantha TaxID=192012 RepID=A0A5N6PR49_9ASTR|nr:hypothetical protein E3N88_07290 [Mikania micrantha]